MSDTPFDYSLPSFKDLDPNLEDAMKEIAAILEKRKISGAIQLSSSTHARYHIHFADWLAIKVDYLPEGMKLHVVSSLDNDGVSHLESSLHSIYTIRDMLLAQASHMTFLCDKVTEILSSEGIEVTHRSLEDQLSEE